LYTLIAGMREVVEDYRNDRDVIALLDIFQTLITGYRDDIEKYSPRDNLTPVFRHVINIRWQFASQRITFEKFSNSNYKSREMADQQPYRIS
jgi:hypothetical protein